MIRVIQEKDFDTLRYYIGKGDVWDHRALEALVRVGDVPVLQWAVENSIPLSAHALYLAVKNGREDIMRLLVESGCPMDSYVSTASRTLDVLLYLVGQGCPWDATELCAKAVTHRRVDILEWAVRNNPAAPADGGGELGVEVGVAAAKHKHTDLLKLVVEKHGCPVDASTTRAAICAGHLGGLKWLVAERKCPLPDDACVQAAMHDHLDVLKYVREQGCEWEGGDNGYNDALREGHYTLMAWAINNGLDASKAITDFSFNQPSVHDHLIKCGCRKDLLPHSAYTWE